MMTYVISIGLLMCEIAPVDSDAVADNDDILIGRIPSPVSFTELLNELQLASVRLDLVSGKHRRKRPVQPLVGVGDEMVADLVQGDVY